MNTKAKYKYVYPFDCKKRYLYYVGRISINGVIKKKMFKKEYDAAKWVDMILIEHGREPVNVLKRV